MRWKPIPERVVEIIVLPIAIPVAICAIPIFLPVIGAVWLERRLAPSHDWHPWFAWRPVKTGHWADDVRQWIWLERIERRGQPYNWPTEYRATSTERGR